MFDFVICDRSPISVQRIMDKKFDEDVDVCEKTAYIEKKAAEEKQQKKLEKIKDEYLKKVKETEDEYLMALAKEQIKLAFEQSEKEVADLHQRTREGLLTARLNGKQVGRKKGIGFETKKSKAAKEKIRIHCKAFGGTLDDMECMKLTGRARNTYYKYKRQIRADLTDEGKLKKEELLCKTKSV